MLTEYLILSLKWHGPDLITWWRPDNGGYTHSLLEAGRYAADQVAGDEAYYHNGEFTLAVPLPLPVAPDAASPQAAALGATAPDAVAAGQLAALRRAGDVAFVARELARGTPRVTAERTPPAEPGDPPVALDRHARIATIAGVAYALRVKVDGRGETVAAFGPGPGVWLLGTLVRHERGGAVAVLLGSGARARAHPRHLAALARAWFDGALRCGPACDARLPRPFVHVWVTHGGVRCCRVCGACWQRLGRQPACRGAARITLRAADGEAPA